MSFRFGASPLDTLSAQTPSRQPVHVAIKEKSGAHMNSMADGMEKVFQLRFAFISRTVFLLPNYSRGVYGEKRNFLPRERN